MLHAHQKETHARLKDLLELHPFCRIFLTVDRINISFTIHSALAPLPIAVVDVCCRFLLRIVVSIFPFVEHLKDSYIAILTVLSHSQKMLPKHNPADAWLALLPLLPPLVVLARLLDNPIVTLQKWIKHLSHHGVQVTDYSDLKNNELLISDKPSIGAQLVAYVTMAVLGYIATSKMVPTIKHYTLRKGISGKDLGKKGTQMEDEQVYVPLISFV